MPPDHVRRKLCSICAHPEVAAIAAAVQRGDSLRTIEAAYGVNKSSVSRHMRNCLDGVSAASQAVTMPALDRDPVAPTMGNDTVTLPASHDEARRLRHAATHAIDAYHLQKVMIGVCALLERMATAPQAPAHVHNPQLHHAVRQIYNALVDHSVPWDTRQALAAVVHLLLQVVTDSEG